MGLDSAKNAPPLKSVGDYDLLQQIGEGGMGTVYKGKHRETGQIVAVKIVPANMTSNQVLLKRFENEFRAASKLNHPNVIRALEYGQVANRPYLVMEFVDGETVGEKLEREGKIAEEESVRIIALAAKGLQEAHNQGLIHRDVKPDNIMVTRTGEVKLADLGLVKETEADMNLTRTGRGLGTPHFMSPEQFRNAKNADVRCDIYSLGATMYMMVTGKLPFEGCGPLDAWMKKVHNDIAPPRKLVPKLSERLDAAIQRSMSPDAKMRQGTCEEFVADLMGEGTAPPPPPPSPVKDGPAVQDIWYLVYKDEEGTTHTVKGSTASIRRSLQEGLLGDAANIRASRSKTGTFEPLRNFSEFKDLISQGSVVRPHVTNTPTHIPSVPTNSGLNTPSGSGGMLHIPVEPNDNHQNEWTKLGLLALLAMAAGMFIFYLMNR